MAIKKLSYLDLDPATRRKRAVEAIRQLQAQMADPQASPEAKEYLQYKIARMKAWAAGTLEEFDSQPPKDEFRA